MSSQDVIKSTAKKLKYYMEVKRLEDAFDLSGPDKPQKHYPTLKPRPTLLYDGLHDRSLKHYFRSPEVKKHMAQMNPKGSHFAREDKVRRDVDKYMARTQYTNPYSTIIRPRATAPKKRRSNFQGGPILLRSKHGPYLSKGETERLVNTATKLLVASETVPIEEGKRAKKYSAKVYAMQDSGVGGSLPIIQSSPYTYPPQRPDRPKSNYGIRTRSAHSMNGRPKTSRGVRPSSAVYNPSSKRYGYDQYGQRIRIRPTPPPNHYEASESEPECDDSPTNILVPVRSGGSQTPEWLNIKMSKVDMGTDMQLVDADIDDDEEEEEEEDNDSINQEPSILQNDTALVSYDNTTQTGVDTAMQTVERDNTKDTQTRRANTVEALTDPWQAEISMQTEPPPITSSTQTQPPPPEMSTQTVPPPPEISTQTVLPLPETSTQTEPPAPDMSTQTPAKGPEISTQTLPEMSTQTIPDAISTQTEHPLEVSTQITPDPTPSPSEEEEEELDDYDHLRHGPRLKSGKRTIYEMAIHTGNRLGASTRADVHIILYGEKGNTGKIKLKQSKDTKDGKKMKFQKGQIDVFKVESFYVGKLECVTIGHDRRELGCGWYLDKLMIREYGDDISYEFVVERWLSAQDEDGRTVRTLPVTNIIMDVSSSESDSEATDFVERSADSSVYTDTDPHLSQVTEMDGHFVSDGGSTERSEPRRRHRRRRVPSTTTATETDSDTDVTDTTRSRGNRTDRTDSSGSGSGSGSGSSSGSSSGSETEGGDRGGRRRSGKGDGDSDNERTGSSGGYYRGGHPGEPQHSEPLPTDVRDASVSMPKQSTPINSRHPSPHPPSSSDERSKGRTAGDFMSGYMAGIKAKEEEERRKKEREEEEEAKKREEEERLLAGPSIHECCKKGNLDRAKQLITLKPELKDTPDERGWTPLHCATAAGKLDIVKWLIVNDVNVNMLTPTGYSGMHQAAMNGHKPVMMVLAAMGVDVNCKTVDQQTPLHLAAMSGHLDCCKWLVANKACEDCEDIMGRSPLELASDYQHADVERFLQSCRTDLTQADSSLSVLRSESPSRSPGQNQADSQQRQSQEESGAAAAAASADEEAERPATPKQAAANKQDLMARQQSFHHQQEKMSRSGMSFLDSIRAEYEDTSQEQQTV
ncbi:uncharacterized protein [Diadema antillarum]|uniref:uncharacterized protein n=1 Tax=Diadema antillarum TaxID=105358 RepID=UPI003A86273B